MPADRAEFGMAHQGLHAAGQRIPCQHAVRIGERQDLPAGLRSTPGQSVLLTLVALQHDEVELQLGLQASQNLGRPVRRAIVNDDDFEIVAAGTSPSRSRTDRWFRSSLTATSRLTLGAQQEPERQQDPAGGAAMSALRIVVAGVGDEQHCDGSGEDGHAVTQYQRSLKNAGASVPGSPLAAKGISPRSAAGKRANPRRKGVERPAPMTPPGSGRRQGEPGVSSVAVDVG